VDDRNLTKKTVSMVRLYSPNPPQQQAAGPSGIRRSNSNISTESDASSVSSWTLDNQSSPMKYSKLDPIVALDLQKIEKLMEKLSEEKQAEGVKQMKKIVKKIVFDSEKK
jgi:hypothetical protein